MWRRQKENGATQTGYTVSYIGLSFRAPLKKSAFFTPLLLDVDKGYPQNFPPIGQGGLPWSFVAKSVHTQSSPAVLRLGLRQDCSPPKGL